MQKNTPHIALFASLLFWSNLLTAQFALSPDFSFSNRTGQLLDNPNFKSRLVVAVADLNNDQLDDIIRLSGGNFLEIQLQDNGRPFSTFYQNNVSAAEQFSICLADVDRNGWNDLLLGDTLEGMKLLQFDQNGQTSGLTDLEDAVFFVQGANWADINADGWIDAFVCNDHGPSRIWMNDGAGNLRPDPSIINLEPFSPAEMNAGNYSSIWTDFDNDNDLDLYISKCYSTAFSMTDPRRVNQLFVNDGQNNFEERAQEFGLADGLQSWTSDFQDIDNDGDLDCIVVNHYSFCKLYENDGTGHYTDITVSSQLSVTDNYLQVAMRDFDNDGFVDILFAGVDGYEFYYNLGNKTFKKVNDLFNDFVMGTFAIGDLNYDGFPDVYSGSADDIDSDVLWINEGEDENHYLSLSLKGVTSNINAIGTRIKLYGDWGVQVREVRSGEGYGIMNSLSQTFGLGISETIDSLVVHWPSGQIERFLDVEVDQHLHLVEGDCLYPGKNVITDGPLVLCEGEEVTLKAPKGNLYYWSTGEATSSITVAATGDYAVTVTNKYGCTSFSNEIKVVVDPDETPEVQIEGDTIFCRGSSFVRLSVPFNNNLQWSTGEQSSSILVRSTGEYSVTVAGQCRSFTSDPIQIYALDPQMPNAIGDTIPRPGFVTLRSDGMNAYWYDEFNQLMGTGANLSLWIDQTTSYWVEEVEEMADVSCSSRRTKVTAYVDPLLNVRDPAEIGIELYPNPFEDQLFVDLRDAGEEIRNIELINLGGQQLVDYVAPRGLFSAALGEVPSGLYLIRLHSESTVYTAKLFKMK